jgi:hypothetical protein
MSGRVKNEPLDGHAGEIMSALAVSHIISRPHVSGLDDCRVRKLHKLLVISEAAPSSFPQFSGAGVMRR